MIDYLRCDDTTHDYGRPDVCLTCFEAHVREDERTSQATLWHRVDEQAADARRQGYAAALRDAVNAVKALSCFGAAEQGHNEKAVAAIEALGSDSN